MSAASKTAVLTAHGQPSAPAPAEAELARLAQAVAAFLPGWNIRSATLSSPGLLEQTAVERSIIYPFFMSKGWFTSKVLPERLEGRQYIMASPFGLDPLLPDVAAHAVRAAATDQGWPLQDLPLLLAAHGSARGPKAGEAAEAFAVQLRSLLPGCRISTGYVEQDPYVEAAAKPLPANALCLPFFAQAGDHVKQDIPEALQKAEFAGKVLPVAGALPGAAKLIAKAILAAAPAADR